LNIKDVLREALRKQNVPQAKERSDAVFIALLCDRIWAPSFDFIAFKEQSGKWSFMN
jgi:hypothetical protein